MKKRNYKAFYCLTILSLIIPIYAFDSFPGGGIHKEITEDAMKGFGFTKEATKKVTDANYGQDWDEVSTSLKPGKGWVVPNKKYDPAHHCDRNAGETHAAAAARGAKYIQDKKKAIIDAVKDCNFKDALDCLGKALHALQDFYSHSNYVDLSPADQAQADKALTDPGTAMPGTIKMTGYDKKTGKDPKGDSYGHDAHAKDNPTKNADAKTKDASGKTNFDKAKEAATKASKDFIQCIKDMVPEEKWDMFKNWKPD